NVSLPSIMHWYHIYTYTTERQVSCHLWDKQPPQHCNSFSAVEACSFLTFPPEQLGSCKLVTCLHNIPLSKLSRTLITPHRFLTSLIRMQETGKRN
uniref:Uncharacterized protein n=1 Tax=Otus sunia TaxID=257818 RepID=A0A8C8AQ54_9STRI